MGQATSSSVKSLIETSSEKAMNVLCFCRKKGASSGSKGGSYKYGSLAMGQYDESDDEDAKGMLYNNNLLLDDDDDEEEQIVIITKEKTAKPEQIENVQPVDHSVFSDGQGLLDMGSKPDQASQPSYNHIMQRMEQQQKHDDAVNEVMEEIEDHLDSDEDDQAYLVTKNSSTGGNEIPAQSQPFEDAQKPATDYDQYG